MIYPISTKKPSRGWTAFSLENPVFLGEMYICKKRWYYVYMRKVRAQIQELHKTASLDEQNKMILGVGRKITELTVKAMAMDPDAMEKVVRAALREPDSGPMPLTMSMQELFNVRLRDLADSSANVPRMQEILAKRDRSMVGTDARHTDIHELTMHLCNELNSISPLSKPTLAFVSQVNSTNVLGRTTEEWTLNAWKDEFSSYAARTPRGMDPVIMGLTKMHQQSPSLALAARPDSQGMTELVHKVANSSLVEELRNVPQTAQGNVVRALFQGDYEGARTEVLRHRNLSNTPTLVVGANLDTTDLDNAGLSI